MYQDESIESRRYQRSEEKHRRKVSSITTNRVKKKWLNFLDEKVCLNFFFQVFFFFFFVISFYGYVLG